MARIDWYALDDNSNTSDASSGTARTATKGISAGWVDQYHHSLEGQRLDLTNAPDADDYYLVGNGPNR